MFREISVLNSWKKVASIVIVLIMTSAIVIIWYRNGISIVQHEHMAEEISVENAICRLDEGIAVEQYFSTDEEYLAGVNLLLVDTEDWAAGEIHVELFNTWGEEIKQISCELNEMPSGYYYFIPLNAELAMEDEGEFLLRIYCNDADIVPGVVIISGQVDVEENGYCYYDGELQEEQGLLIGYVYGEKKFVGYEYVDMDVIILATARTILILIAGVILIRFIFTFKRRE